MHRPTERVREKERDRAVKRFGRGGTRERQAQRVEVGGGRVYRIQNTLFIR